MRKTRWLLIGLLLACIGGVVLVVVALLPPPPGITKENFDRIEVGMTRAEIEAILGGPANGRDPRNGLRIGLNAWEDDSSGDLATIDFDEKDRVTSKHWWFELPDDRTLWEKLIDRLPWREKPPPPPRFIIRT
jgi:hypothetical protein